MQRVEKEVLPYIVSASLASRVRGTYAYANSAHRTLDWIDALVHAATWIVASVLEICLYADIQNHVNQLHAANQHMLQAATIDAYEATSLGALLTLLIASLVVVGSILFHIISQGIENGRLISFLLGAIIAGVKASILFNVVVQIIFLCEDRTAQSSALAFSSNPVVWAGEPRLWVAVVALKMYGLSMIEANVGWVGPAPPVN